MVVMKTPRITHKSYQGLRGQGQGLDRIDQTCPFEQEIRCLLCLRRGDEYRPLVAVQDLKP